MTPADAKRTICGPLIPLITHYRDDLSVDHDAVRENVRYVVERGVRTGSGVLLAAGAGGDFPMLTLDERKAVSETIVRAADGRTPVVVGAQDTNPARSVELARFAEDIGAWGIQLAPGYYYASSPDDCYRVFEAVHEATSTLGIMIYNTYWEGYDMSLDEVERLAELPRCAALKWSTARGVLDYQRGVERFRERLAVIDNYGSPGHDPPARRAGIHHPPVHRLARARPRGLSSAGSGRLRRGAAAAKRRQLAVVRLPGADVAPHRSGEPRRQRGARVDGQEGRPEPAPHAPPRRVRARRAENAPNRHRCARRSAGSLVPFRSRSAQSAG